MIAWRTSYDYWLLLRNFAPVLVWNSYGDSLTDHLRLLAFAGKLCTSSGVKLLLWLPDGLPTTTGFCCETLNLFLFWNFYGDCQIDYLWLPAFAAKLCKSSGVKLLRWLPDRLTTTTGFCCETLHQFWCENLTVIAWRTTYDYCLLLRNCTPVLVSNFYYDCLTDYLRLLAFAAKLWTCSGSKTFTVIARLTTYDYRFLPRNFPPFLV